MLPETWEFHFPSVYCFVFLYLMPLLKTRRKKKRFASQTLSLFPSKIMVSYTLCFLPLCSKLVLYSSSLYSKGFNLLCISSMQTHTPFCFSSYMQTNSAPQISFWSLIMKKRDNGKNYRVLQIVLLLKSLNSHFLPLPPLFSYKHTF